MRRLPKPGKLPKALTKALANQTETIKRSSDPKAEADRLYGNARQTKWFKPVVDKLKKLSGMGQRCMLCSGSESSDVEHFCPKAVFPLLAMTWDNYLWCCTPCNRIKGDRFPPDTQAGGRFINPLIEDVWEFFFIDDFGFLTPVYDKAINALNERAVSTRDLIGLDREALQESRLARLKDLRTRARDTIKLLKLKRLTLNAAKKRVATWRNQPFQPDVADYFLNGPGQSESPFKELFRLL